MTILFVGNRSAHGQANRDRGEGSETSRNLATANEHAQTDCERAFELVEKAEWLRDRLCRGKGVLDAYARGTNFNKCHRPEESARAVPSKK